MRTAIEGARKGAPPAEIVREHAGSEPLLKQVVHWLDEAKAEQIVTIDLKGKSSIGDFMVIATGRSDRHVGGISEQRRIAWMAYDLGITYVGHGWNTALGLAADLQMASAFPETDLVEFIGGSPYVDDLLDTPFALDAQGRLAIPDRPGLGVVPDRERVARYTPDARALIP